MSLSEELQTLLDKGIESKAAPGLVALVFNKTRIVAEAASGVRRADDQAPISTSTTVWHASISKAIISFALLRLVEEHGFNIHSHEELIEVLPEFASGSGEPVSKTFGEKKEDGRYDLVDQQVPATLAHLLAHTSGLGYEFGHEITATAYAPLGTAPLPSSGEVAYANIPRVFEAGKGWLYGCSAAWLGFFIERLAKKPLRRALQDLIFIPLGVPPDTLDTFLTPKLKENWASLHHKSEDKSFTVLSDYNDHQWEFDPPEGKHVISDAPLHGPITGLVIFGQLLLNQSSPSPTSPPLISPTLWKAATSDALAPLELSVSRPVLKSTIPFLASDVDVFSKIEDEDLGEGWTYLQMVYNRGKSLTGRNVGSLSWSGLANSYFFVDPVAGVGGIIAAQFFPWGDKDVYDIRDEMERLIYKYSADWKE